MAEIIWTARASRDLRMIREFIRQHDPVAAEKYAARLITKTDNLKDFPHIGRIGKDEFRELTTVPPYIIRYRVEGERVYIVSIIHSAQNR